MPTNNTWKIDKHINVSVLLVVIIQFAGFIYWVSTVDSNMKAQEGRIGKLEQWQIGRNAANLGITERISSTEANVKNINTNLNRIEGKIDRALENLIRNTQGER